MKRPENWALARAVDLANAEREGEPCFYSKRDIDVFNEEANPALFAVARLVEKHEKPPVDPDLFLAREAAAATFTTEHYRNMCLNGRYDESLGVQAALNAIRLVKKKAKNAEI